MNVNVKLSAEGVYECRLYLGTDALGRKIQPYRRFPDAADRDEAQAMAETWAASIAPNGRQVDKPVADLLMEYIRRRRRKSAPNSVRQWEGFVRNHVARLLRRRTARELTVPMMMDYEDALLAPKNEGGLGLSPKTVTAEHQFLSKAFDHWMSSGLVPSNPMRGVIKAPVQRTEASVIPEASVPDLRRALEAAMSGDLSDPVSRRSAACALAAWLSLNTGVRLGEACAVRRCDIDLDRENLHIGGTIVELKGEGAVRQPRTKGGKSRNVSLSPETASVLSGFLERQAAVIRCGPDTPVVTVDGSFMRPRVASGRFSELRKELGLPPGVTFHSLRHTHATLLLKSGIDLKTVSERLGHADTTTTLRLYAHVLPGQDAAAAARFDEITTREG